MGSELFDGLGASYLSIPRLRVIMIFLQEYSSERILIYRNIFKDFSHVRLLFVLESWRLFGFWRLLIHSLFFITQGNRLSDVYLQETFLMFTENIFHALCHSNATSSRSVMATAITTVIWIRSWWRININIHIHLRIQIVVGIRPLLASNPTQWMILDRSHWWCRVTVVRRIPKLNINFSSPTISTN